MERKEKEIEEIKKFRKKYNEDHANDYDNEWGNDENALKEFEGFKKFENRMFNEIFSLPKSDECF